MEDNYFRIDFWEFSKPKDHVIMFKIRDINAEVVGYAVASSASSYEIVWTDSSVGLPMAADTFLNTQFEKFCKVYYANSTTQTP